MKKILWVSRHPMNGIQMPALRRMFGEDAEVVEETRPFDSAEKIVARYREGRFDDIIVVAPLSVLAKMTELGVQPLWSEAVICPKGQHDWETNGRFYRFARFRRIRRLALEFDELGESAVRRETDSAPASGTALRGWKRTPLPGEGGGQ